MYSTEQELIGEIRHLVPEFKEGIGIGDDAAVIDSVKGKLVLTTDSLVESVHFQRKWVTPFYLGQKAALINLSDIAAMGANPRFALVSLLLSYGDFNRDFIQQLYKGILKELNPFKVKIIGGNISQSKELAITINLIGESKGSVLSRSGACVGDDLYVSGVLGDAAAELALLLANKKKQMEFLPIPRIKFAQSLAKNKLATAAMDISDSLALDLYRLTQASRVNCEIIEESLPVSEITINLSQKHGYLLSDWLLFGGEVYELIFCADSTLRHKIEKLAKETRTPVSRIGKISAKSKSNFIHTVYGTIKQLATRGWDHGIKSD